MRGFIRDLVARRRSKVANRRRAALRKAAREMQRDTDEGSIWRSGKGGGHHDRI
jgi:hypothetical protein